MSILSLRETPVMAPSEATLLFQHILKNDFSNPDITDHVMIFFALIGKLAHNSSIPWAPGRRWNRNKAREYQCQALIEEIAKVFNKIVKRLGNAHMTTPLDRELFFGLLEVEGMAVGPKGQDTFRRTMYCLHTPKGNIPLDQPLVSR
jgi:hypothetical protein